MKKIRIVFRIVMVCVVIFIYCITPKKDRIPAEAFPQEYMITKSNYIDYQKNNECSAYACAYVMRHMERNIEGDELYPSIKRILGFVPASSITEVLGKNGLDVAVYHGTVDTLKQRLCQGTPVIVFTSIPGDTHYMVAVGYDEEHLYFVDSMAENSNAENDYYNRVLITEEFESLWKTNMYFVDNIYIVIN